MSHFPGEMSKARGIKAHMHINTNDVLDMCSEFAFQDFQESPDLLEAWFKW
jgi:hypothetical protein